MKKMNKIAVGLMLVLMMALGLTACGKKDAKDVWADARYTEDTTLGEGEKTLTIVVEAEEKKVTFTVMTDADNVGAALLEQELIAGEEGDYGLYIKEVNGMTADYDEDQSYWAFYQNGEYMMTSADLTPFEDGEQYEFVYTKE